jgi:hypothetical protein
MITEKDRALLQYLADGTARGTLRWEPTARDQEFTAALRGKYSAIVRRNPINDADTLRLENSDGEVMLQIYGGEEQLVVDLWELARRNAYSVDKAIDEILGSGS